MGGDGGLDSQSGYHGYHDGGVTSLMGGSIPVTMVTDGGPHGNREVTMATMMGG